MRHAVPVKLEQPRANVFTLTLTSVELSALVGAARLAADAMARDDAAPRELLTVLERVLADYDRARRE
jgi:hypothetical protein